MPNQRITQHFFCLVFFSFVGYTKRLVKRTNYLLFLDFYATIQQILIHSPVLQKLQCVAYIIKKIYNKKHTYFKNLGIKFYSLLLDDVILFHNSNCYYSCHIFNVQSASCKTVLMWVLSLHFTGILLPEFAVTLTAVSGACEPCPVFTGKKSCKLNAVNSSNRNNLILYYKLLLVTLAFLFGAFFSGE